MKMRTFEKPCPLGGRNSAFIWNYKANSGSGTIRYWVRSVDLSAILPQFGANKTATAIGHVIVPFFVEINSVRFGGTYNFKYKEKNNKRNGSGQGTGTGP